MSPTQPMPQPPADPPAIRYGPFILDLAGFSVSVAGRDVPVTFTEFLLLRTLASNPMRYVDRATLLDVLAGRETDAPRGRARLPAARSVDLHISRLRRKLSQAGYDCIKTMRFVGYRFVPAEQTPAFHPR